MNDMGKCVEADSAPGAGETANRSVWLESALSSKSGRIQHSRQIVKGLHSSPRSGLYLLGNGESWKLFEHWVMRRSTWWKGCFRKIMFALECRQRDQSPGYCRQLEGLPRKAQEWGIHTEGLKRRIDRA